MLYDWDPLGICLSAKEPITVCYWYGAWRREAGAPGGDGEWRLQHGGVRPTVTMQ